MSLSKAPWKLVAENVAIARGERIVQTGLTFALGTGEAMVLTGPNGSGKTTLIRTIAGGLRPNAGRLRLDGGDPGRALAEQCHYVGHLNALKANLTVGENLSFWANYLSVAAGDTRAVVDHGLDRLGIAGLREVPAGYLSAGQQRRTALARLLVADRPLWLLDEPTVSLDQEGQDALVRIINAHLAKGGIAIVATHARLGVAHTRELVLAALANA